MPRLDAEDMAKRVGARVAELREERALTQLELATQIRTTTQWLSRIELGRQNLTLATLVKLANALDVALTELFVAPKTAPKARGKGRPKRL